MTDNLATDITMSPEIEKLAAALSLAQKSIQAAKKDKQAHNYKYADLAECWTAAREALTENGLAVSQWPLTAGKRVTITTLLLHSSGQWIKGSFAMDAKDSYPQAVGSCITYGRRYGFCAAIGIAPEDDDGKAAMPDPDARRAPIQAPRQMPRHEPEVKQPRFFNKKDPEECARLRNWLAGEEAAELYDKMVVAMNGKEVRLEVLKNTLTEIQVKDESGGDDPVENIF
jgi:hypothetical protein